MDAGRLKAAFVKAADLLEAWQSHQDAACRLMANASNILQRLPALKQASNFSGLYEPQQLQQLVLGKQLKALDNVLGRLHSALQAMEGTVAGMERVCVDAWRLAGAGGPSLSMRVAVTPQPAAASASIALMLESMEDAWYMCRDDLARKSAAAALLHHGSGEEECAAIGAAFSRAGVDPCSAATLALRSVAQSLR